MTEKRFNARKNIDNDYFEERLKVVLEDIVGSVHSDDVTNSVELKKEYYKSRMTENKRYSEQNLENHLNRIYDNHECKVIFDDEIIDLLNEQEKEIQRLKKELKNRKKLNTILEGFLLDKGYDFNDILKFLQDRTEKREGE